MDDIDMAGVLMGDRDAFDRLVNRNWKRLVRWLRRLARDEAEDIAQEAFLRLWKCQRYVPGSFKGYLRKIASNLVIDKCRQRRPCLCGDLVSEDVVCDFGVSREPDPCESASYSEMRDAVEWMLWILPESQARAFRDCVNGESHSRVSQREDIPVATSKGQLRLARAKIRRSLVLQ